MEDRKLIEVVREGAQRLASPGGIDDVVDRASKARLVLLGEASHGTHEFYELRAQITQRLITHHGFHAVAVEADWPDAYQVNCFARGRGKSEAAADALGGFRRFPAWMWRNRDVLAFVEWLRNHNDRQTDAAAKVGFYGLDLYSLFNSIEQVIAYLDKVDPQAAARARQRYACFDHYGDDSEAYGFAMRAGSGTSCEEGVVAQLVEFQRQAAARALPDGDHVDEDLFHAEQNARVARNAEHYYRTMFNSSVRSWNVRDQHMAESLDAIIGHLDARVGQSKIVVWAHNSHLGDARATEMGVAGELNLGQLARERYGAQVFSVGFTTYEGAVTAASQWGGAAETKQVRPALYGSYEAIFHATGLGDFVLPLDAGLPAAGALAHERLERAIGVIYLPQRERMSHYFHAQLSSQFNMVVHIDRTTAVEPLERATPTPTAEAPETYPSAL